MGGSAGSLSLSEARRMAIAAQGLHLPRPRARPTAAELAGVIHRLGLLQLDFVNVLLPAHYLVLYSRLGMYDKGLFHDLV
ncbi:MAG: winged helix-turn-helix domain-containing protein, partial [Bryobacterales bacterium]|nr:winged helix-turn-helix domain-containing protein [Bryobacterales bacterium]